MNNSDMDEKGTIINFDWNQLSAEELQLIQSKISKAIQLKKRGVTKSTFPSQKHSYKATLAKVCPSSLRMSLSDYHKCVFGISLKSKNYIDERKLKACIKWISENFKDCQVLVCDSIYRLTIQVRQGIREDEAWLEAISTGKNFVNQNYRLFEQYSENCRFEFVMNSEIEKQSESIRYYDELRLLYVKNELFQNTVNSFANKYLNRSQREEAEEPDDFRQTQLAITYLLEELALNAYLIQKGWLVFVYPGSIKTFEEISEGLHPEVPEPLKQMIWVSLRLKKRNSAIAQ